MNLSCVAGVLAGGASRRLGTPKALIQLPNGRTMLEHVVAIASSVAAETVVLGQPPAVPPALESIPILADAESGRGPMSGLRSLLAYAAPRWGLLLACDLPALRAPPLQRLIDAAMNDPDADAAAFVCQHNRETYEACCAMYHPRLESAVIDRLRTGATSLQLLLREVHTLSLIPTEREAPALVDVDTTQDLDALADDMA